LCFSTLEESRRELQGQLDELEQRKNETVHQNQLLEREINGLKVKKKIHAYLAPSSDSDK
jgi:cell division protein FtsB